MIIYILLLIIIILIFLYLKKIKDNERQKMLIIKQKRFKSVGFKVINLEITGRFVYLDGIK